jgi:hypothetical protein
MSAISILVALSGLACVHAQPPIPPEPDQPSNGMLELRVKQIFDPEPPPRKIDPPREPMWHGTVAVTVKNISRDTVRFVEGAGTYEFTVLDASGNPAPLTEYGKRALAPTQNPPSF